MEKEPKTALAGADLLTNFVNTYSAFTKAAASYDEAIKSGTVDDKHLDEYGKAERAMVTCPAPNFLAVFQKMRKIFNPNEQGARATDIYLASLVADMERLTAPVGDVDAFKRQMSQFDQALAEQHQYEREVYEPSAEHDRKTQTAESYDAQLKVEAGYAPFVDKTHAALLHLLTSPAPDAAALKAKYDAVDRTAFFTTVTDPHREVIETLRADALRLAGAS